MMSEKYGRGTLLVGPWGGQDGLHWDDGVYSTIRQLEIYHGSGIDSIKVEYDNNGSSVWSEKHGGRGGSKIDKVKLQYPDEFLTSLHGHYGSLRDFGPIFIRSLTFESNKRKYGPYGVEEGTYFTFPPTHGRIVGFLGKSGWYLDAIGVYLQTPSKPVVTRPMLHSQQVVKQGSEKYEYSMMQGGVGQSYDIIVALRRKDDRNNPLTQKTSHESSYNEHKNQTISTIKNIEEIPPKTVRGVVACGPWGGNGGSLFDDGVYDGIRQINLSRNVGIVSIQVCYDKNGQSVWGSKNGGMGSFKKDQIIFNYPSEILTHITGHHGPAVVMGPEVVKSLTFHTTRGKYGPYGEEQGQFFSSKLQEGSTIIGFHGKKGLFMDAIGIHALKGQVVHPPSSYHKEVVIPPNYNSTPNFPPKPKNETALVPYKAAENPALVPYKAAENSQWNLSAGRRPTEQTVHRMVKDPAPFGSGPWGGDGGKPWDDGVYTGIKQIVLTMADAITCIEVEYDRNGQSVWSVKHGGSGGHIANRVKFDYPHEVLTCVSGYYGPVYNNPGSIAIQSLTIHTSRRKYGPFGAELGTYFASGKTEGKVVGFHGRSSMYLDAIGVHMQHWLGNQKIKPSLMKRFS